MEHCDGERLRLHIEQTRKKLARVKEGEKLKDDFFRDDAARLALLERRKRKEMARMHAINERKVRKVHRKKVRDQRVQLVKERQLNQREHLHRRHLVEKAKIKTLRLAQCIRNRDHDTVETKQLVQQLADGREHFREQTRQRLVEEDRRYSRKKKAKAKIIEQALLLRQEDLRVKALLKLLEYKVITQAVPLKVVDASNVVAIAELTDEVAYNSTAIGDLEMRLRVSPRAKSRTRAHSRVPRTAYASARPTSRSNSTSKKKSPRQVWLSPNEDGFLYGES